jgi:hypothetical protein
MLLTVGTLRMSSNHSGPQTMMSNFRSVGSDRRLAQLYWRRRGGVNGSFGGRLVPPALAGVAQLQAFANSGSVG